MPVVAGLRPLLSDSEPLPQVLDLGRRRNFVVAHENSGPVFVKNVLKSPFWYAAAN